MRSAHADFFNHDDDAVGYDSDVQNEADPIRTGYQACLNWVAAETDAVLRRNFPGAKWCLVDLGAGTGNLTERLPLSHETVCVDVSAKMSQLAQEKLRGRRGVRFMQQDLLEWAGDFAKRLPGVHAVVSTYAIHHLLESEKATLFADIASLLLPGGVFVCGDLMFESRRSRASYLDTCRTAGRPEFAKDIEEEFFWDLQRARSELQRLGLETKVERFSELSWGILARRVRPVPPPQ